MATASGGSGAYTHTWTHVSGQSASINAPASATTNFTRSATAACGGWDYTDVFRVTVSDGTTSATADVTFDSVHARPV